MALAPGHPYRTIVTTPKRDFGFVRISKCASSTVTRNLSLRVTIPQEDAALATMPLFAAVREPRERLLSSFPETLLRLAPAAEATGALVPASQEIWRAFTAIDSSDYSAIALGLIEMIRQHGFFDSHHQPMGSFLQDHEGKTFKNLKLFAVDDVEYAITVLRLQYQRSQLFKKIEARNVRLPASASTTRSVGGGRRLLHPDSPLGKLHGSCETGRAQVVAGEFYRRIQQDRDVSAEVESIVNSHYSGDKELWSLLRARRNRKFLRMDL